MSKSERLDQEGDKVELKESSTIDAEGQARKEMLKQAMKAEQNRLKVKTSGGEYKFDNPDLEYVSKRQKKRGAIEDKYKDKPRIAFHQLTDEGTRQFMQAKRDRVFTTLGWSVIGTFAGIGAMTFFEAYTNRRWKGNRYVKQKDLFRLAVFGSTLGLFTLIGFGNARLTFVKQKLEIVK